ncbi:MarR family transcriptional regulator [Streptococcus oralis]|jgi:transcriptional regulator, MarR family|uniref:Transcriptional regulator SlyA n=2 Tax=Streptococcus TaxID=1301 RepID=A0A3R9I5C3_STRMT|nr:MULTISPECIES: MarR family transcriptional regulator [Streptococcus]MBU6862986.1 MarR family transcriptional regulator [Streptococcus oralis]MCM3308908.1 MarR family transcriptional regulator [Streptococcus oralis]RSI80607.1 transcriptional regulator SlyA [Streptococcus mitis]RSK09088.1 transcriptional regulator SlyA [Streptococcus oralis]
MKYCHLVAHHIRLLNGRIFQKLLRQDPDSLYRSEQGKILAVLWNSKTGCATATDIALATGLANNTLTTMIKKLEEQNLVIISPCGIDKRKKYVKLTEQGLSQKEVGRRVSQKLDAIFYKGFTEEEVRQFEVFQERILANLKEKVNEA